MASWAALQGERENDQVSERTERVGNRIVHQRMSKTGGTDEYNVVIGDRFIVTAKGDGIEFDALRSAVSALDLQKLEAMKERSEFRNGDRAFNESSAVVRPGRS